MLDLRTGAVTDWLQLVRPVEATPWPPPVRPVETTPQAEASLIELGEQLTRGSDEDPAGLATELRHHELVPELQALLAQLGAAMGIEEAYWKPFKPDESLRFVAPGVASQAIGIAERG